MVQGLGSRRRQTRAPTIDALPVISGTPESGKLLTATHTDWHEPAAITVARSWAVGPTAIGPWTVVEAGVDSILQQDSMIGSYIRYSEWGKLSPTGKLTQANSAAVGPVAAATAVPSPVDVPIISATANHTGTVVSVESMGEYAPNATRIDWQWFRGPDAISGAEGDWIPGEPLPMYATTDDDELEMITLGVVPRNAHGPGEQVSSNAVGPFLIPEIAKFAFVPRETLTTLPVDSIWTQWLHGSTNPYNALETLREPWVDGQRGNVKFGVTAGTGLSVTNRTPSAPPPNQPERFGGIATYGGSTLRCRIDLPNGKYRLEMGVGNVTSSSTPSRGWTFWDGAKSDASPIVLLTTQIKGLAIPSNHAMDVNGDVHPYAAWDSLRATAEIEVTRGFIEFGVLGSGSGGLNYLKLTNVYTEVVTSGDSVYYVDYDDGNDMNDGLTPETAWKHAPMDQDAGGLVPIFGLLPGARLRFKNGISHYPAGFSLNRTEFLRQSVSGTALRPIVVEGYGEGSPFRLVGREKLGTGWSAITSAQAHGNPGGDLGKLFRRTMPNPMRGWEAPYEGERRLYPAQWPRPTDLSQYENDGVGVGAFRRLADGDAVAWSGSTPDGVTGQPYTITITLQSPSLRPVSMVGAPLVYSRLSSNIIQTGRISHHNIATGVLKAVMNADDAPFLNASFAYCLRYSPYDIGVGQYGYDLSSPTDPFENLICYFNSTDVALRSIQRLNTGVTLRRDYWEFHGGIYADFTSLGTDPTVPKAIRISGSTSPIGIVVDGVHARDFTSGANLGQRAAVFDETAGVRYINAKMTRCFLSSGFRSLGTNANVHGFTTNRPGRSAVTIGSGRDADIRDLVLCNDDSRHGNGLSDYYSTPDGGTSTVDGIRIMNSTRPITWGNQANEVEPGYMSPLSVTLKNMICTPRFEAVPAATPPGLQSFTGVFDPNGRHEGTIMERAVMVGGWSAFRRRRDSHASLPLLRIQGAIFEGITIASDSGGPLGNPAFEIGNAIITANSAYGNVANLAQLIERGGVIVGHPDSVVFADQPWNGIIPPSWWEVLSRDFRAGNWGPGSSSPTAYEEFRFDSAWEMPAWGEQITNDMMVCAVDVDEITEGWGAHYSIASVFGYPPSVAVSLPAGEEDNDLFYLFKGQLRLKANLAIPRGETITWVFELTPQAAAGVSFQSMTPVRVNVTIPIV